MKKLYFLFLACSSAMFGQTVVFDQPVTGTNGIVSNVLSNGNGVYSADDFTVAEQTQLTKVTLRGFQNDQNLSTIYQGMRLMIYTNGASNIPSGIPGGLGGTIVADLDVVGTQAGITLTQTAQTVVFDIDLTTALPSPVIVDASTTYWLVFAPKVNLTAYTAAARFNWNTGTGASGTNYQAKLVDPANAFGAGATNWTTISTLTNNTAFNNLSFTLEGTTLGVTDFSRSTRIDAYPNPTSDVVSISVSNSDFSDFSYQLFDLNGRKIMESKQAEINLKHLDNGVYFVNVFADNTKIGTKKIVKN